MTLEYLIKLVTLLIEKSFMPTNLYQVNTSTLKNGIYIVNAFYKGENIRTLKMIITENDKR